MLMSYVFVSASCSVVICHLLILFVFFFKQKTAYEMRISDWSSDVCSSDLGADPDAADQDVHRRRPARRRADDRRRHRAAAAVRQPAARRARRLIDPLDKHAIQA